MGVAVEVAGGGADAVADGGEAFDPEEVHAWALMNGWTEEGANSLAQIARDVNAGKKVRPRRKWAPDAIERMRARARSGAPPQVG